MEKVDIFDQEVGRAAIECNGNLVVVFNGKKAFWFKEQIESFVKEHPEAPLKASSFSFRIFCLKLSYFSSISSNFKIYIPFSEPCRDHMS